MTGFRNHPRPALPKELVAEPRKLLTLTRIEPRVPPAVSVIAEPTRCYKINLEWAAHMSGAVSTLLEIAAWSGADDERFAAVQAFLEFLEGDSCMAIDCGDVEDCLEQSITIVELQNAIYQTEALSYSEAKAETVAHVADLQAIYDGTPQSIGSQIPVGVPTQAENDALCHTLFNIVRAYQNEKSREIFNVTAGDVFMSEVWQSLRRLFYAVTRRQLFHLLGSEIYDCVDDYTEALGVMADYDQREQLVCCLHSDLAGLAMSEANWNAAVSTCASGNALGCFFDNDNTQDNYLLFLEAYNSVLVEQAANTNADITDCPCDWVEVFDFAAGDTRWNLSTQPEPSCYPVGVQTAQGWEPEYSNCGFGTGAWRCQIAPPAGNLGAGNYIRRVVTEWVPAVQPAPGTRVRVQARDGGAVTFDSEVVYLADLIGRATMYVTGVHTNASVVMNSAVHTPPDPDRYYIITRITLSGVGVNPYI